MTAFHQDIAEKLRSVFATKKGRHRSATPKVMQMQNTSPIQLMQPQLAFIREGFVNFTPSQAALTLEWCRYERQRDETRAKAHICTLAEQMRRGLWLYKTQIDFASVNGKIILVNGHHRMHAQVSANANIVWSVVIHECATDADVAALYWKFDTTLRKRSSSNILDGIGFAANMGLSKTTARALWDAVPIIANGMKFSKYQNGHARLLMDEVQAIAEGYAAEANIAEGIINIAAPNVRTQLRTNSRLAVMLVTLRHQPERATAFWHGLCSDDGLSKGDPRKALLIDMQNRSHKGLQIANMMACARAWSAFFSGSQMSHLKITGSAVRLAGTPYTVQS